MNAWSATITGWSWSPTAVGVFADDRALADVDPRALGVENRARHHPGTRTDRNFPDQLRARCDVGGRTHGGGVAPVADEHAGEPTQRPGSVDPERQEAKGRPVSWRRRSDGNRARNGRRDQG